MTLHHCNKRRIINLSPLHRKNENNDLTELKGRKKVMLVLLPCVHLISFHHLTPPLKNSLQLLANRWRSLVWLCYIILNKNYIKYTLPWIREVNCSSQRKRKIQNFLKVFNWHTIEYFRSYTTTLPFTLDDNLGQEILGFINIGVSYFYLVTIAQLLPTLIGYFNVFYSIYIQICRYSLIAVVVNLFSSQLSY